MIRKLLFCLLSFLLVSCSTSDRQEAHPEVPRGYYSQLEFVHNGQQLGFGPFVGYYFKPVIFDDMERLHFICYNERQFYSDEIPANERLFEGEAVMTTLSDNTPMPDAQQRINPVFLKQTPAGWLETRPEPKEKFVHFHSAYNQSGAVYTGYWLQHSATQEFTYNMGGRVDKSSPLYHQAKPGEESNFPGIVEFDYGPDYQ